MTAITIHLPEKRAQQLVAEAGKLGVDPETLVLSIIDDRFKNPDSAATGSPKYRQKKSTIATILGIARTDRPPPDDAEVKRYLMERRLKKYGEGLAHRDSERND